MTHVMPPFAARFLPRRPGLLVLAWLLATAWGSVVQTQWNLQALVALGLDLPLALRLQTTAQDLLAFGPLYAGIVAAGWLPAVVVALGLARRWPAGRTALLAAAGGVGLIVAVRAVDAVAPMPAFIDATRGWAGLLAMAAGAALAAGLYGLLSRRG